VEGKALATAVASWIQGDSASWIKESLPVRQLAAHIEVDPPRGRTILTVRRGPQKSNGERAIGDSESLSGFFEVGNTPIRGCKLMRSMVVVENGPEVCPSITCPCLLRFWLSPEPLSF